MKRLSLMLPLFAVCAMVPCALSVPAQAADDDKVPYWASIDTDKAYMRVGPGDSYKIAWVYRRQHLPVRIIRREGPWRQIEDPDGDKGWMRDLLLSRQRAAIVRGDGLIELHAEGRDSSPMLWRVEPGVVGLLGECTDGWCAFDTDGHKGFVHEDSLWGAGEP
ncbi:SH3 domain-containing protein [Novosphingobium album (ex Hu et al. 2023)]|uniref:SH3 domain-containing protein n=1 Tax=Novosphingobium album (ex Hu et al. 2023) TaxID=2930093 RepID=A0ABT0AYJ7_9SPHN|nr:SH3 domain-containing protein [Novosphingobium album (ex Hu et al. 2023)]MCJ2177877.1 SH3 domain-containing protein [Novosphingobium album (ex Hu et al. 2023)]